MNQNKDKALCSRMYMSCHLEYLNHDLRSLNVKNVESLELFPYYIKWYTLIVENVENTEKHKKET